MIERKFVDFDANFKFLTRSLSDKEIKKEFDLEVTRAISQIIGWIRKGDSAMTSVLKAKRSYGTIIVDMALYHLNNNLNK